MNACMQEGDIKTYNIQAWVTAIAGGQVVLPMIQRGSVWKPHQILDLWDTLLQRMPFGAMMASTILNRPVFRGG